MTFFQMGYSDAYGPANSRPYPMCPSHVPIDCDMTLDEARAEYMDGYTAGQAEYNANRGMKKEYT